MGTSSGGYGRILCRPRFGRTARAVDAWRQPAIGLRVLWEGPSSPEMPDIGRALGELAIVAGVIGTLIVGGIIAVIGGVIARQAG